MEDLVNVTYKDDYKIEFTVLPLHEVDNYIHADANTYTLEKHSPESAERRAYEIVASTAGGLALSDISEKSENKEKLVTYATCMRDVATIFGDEGYTNLETSFTKFSKYLLDNAIDENKYCADNERTTAFEKITNRISSGASKIFRNHKNEAIEAREALSSLFEDFVKSAKQHREAIQAISL